MRKLLLVGIAFLLAFCVYTQDAVRGTQWGMSLDEVREIEEAKLIQEKPDRLIYDTKIADMDAFVIYTFHQDKLKDAGYIFHQDHSNKNVYIDDYDKTKNLLTKKYGNPDSAEVVWHNDLYADDPDQYGFAVSIGHLELISIWENDEQVIYCSLRGDNYTIAHTIRYDSKELAKEARSAEEKSTLEEL